MITTPLVGMTVHQIGTWGPGRVLARERYQCFVEWETGMKGWYHRQDLEQGWEGDWAK